MTEALVAEMRGWLSDLKWADMAAEDFADLSESQVRAAVQAHYDGGMDGFVRDSA